VNKLNKAGELYQQGEYKKAERLFIKIKQDDFATLQLGMFIFHKLGKHAFAIKYALKLINKPEFDANSKLIYDVLALSYMGINQLENAILYLEKSVSNNAMFTNADTVFLLLKAYHEKFRVADVELLAPKMLNWTDYSVKAALILIESAKRLSDRELLRERILAILPECTYLSLNDFSRVTDDLINLNELEKAEKFINVYEYKHGALENHFYYKMMKAKLALQHKEYDQVLSILNLPNIDISLPSYFYIQAKAYEKLRDFDNAFQMFQNGALLQQKLYPLNNRSDHVDKLNVISDKLKLHHSQLTHGNERQVKLVFTFGFPRSGTTLLETILETQNNTLSLSELPMLSRVIQAFNTRLNKKYPQDLAKLDESELIILRKVYFDSIYDLGLKIPDSGVVIDKNPHNTQHLPLIKLLFPNAKLILSIRHPLAVCLSCFQNNFAANNNNLFLITLKNIVSRYIQIFSLLEKYQDKLEIDFHTVRYEDLVDDLETVIKQVFDYIDIKHDNSYLEFHKHAAKKFVSSSSRGQTDQPMYTDAKDNWKSYYKYLEPYIDDLQYFIDKFDYSSKP